MTDREQAFDQWFAERYPDTISVYSELPVRNLMRDAYEAGREQGLREAKQACERIVKDNEYAYADECPSAIEQLRGK